MSVQVEEIWKIIPDFPNYRISNTGRVQSRWQKIHYNNDKRLTWALTDNWTDLTIQENQTGKYYYIGLRSEKNETKLFYIHRLLAELFIPKPNSNKPLCVRHLDGNKQNNNLTNLAWGTYSENTLDNIRLGVWKNNTKPKLTPQQVREIRSLKTSNSLTQKEIARQYNVSPMTVSRIVNHVLWRNLND
jgi:hypothetical protein